MKLLIKVGGTLIDSDESRYLLALQIASQARKGRRTVVVHGGGKQLSRYLQQGGFASEFRGGLRVTTPEAMDVVRMVLVGQVGRELVGLVNQHGPFAVGLSGEDAGLFTARRKGVLIDGEDVDIGLVGDVAEVRPDAVHDLLDAGRIPVVSSVAPDHEGVVHNVNADTAAAALAVALDAEKLVVLTDVKGLYRDWPASSEVIGEITADELDAMLPGLDSGMIPKMQACLRAVRGGVAEATVLDGRLRNSLLLEVFTDAGVGTMVVPE